MPLQRETVQVYAALVQREPQWQGKLLLSIGLDRALALAALAAGAATLVLEKDPAVLKEGRRDVTFTVNTLDEALRALKNEIRQLRTITVALTGDPERWLQEINERGVQPHLIVKATQFVSETNHHLPLAEDIAQTLQERRTRDAALVDAHPNQRRWLQAAPTLFPRDLSRVYLSDDQGLQPLP